jgi:hypothetical protein
MIKINYYYYFSPVTCSIFSWPFSPYRSGFAIQTAALCLQCAMFLVGQRLFFINNLLNAFLILFLNVFNPLVTISVAPTITRMLKHFIFHTHQTSALTFYILNYFVSCITFLSDGIAASINNQILSSFFLTISLACATDPSVCTP